MRCYLHIVCVLLLVGSTAAVQGTPPPMPPNLIQPSEAAIAPSGPTAPIPAPTPAHGMRGVVKEEVKEVREEVKKEVEKALAQNDPSVDQWRPLTTGQKFHVFLWSTYRPRTFAEAAVNTAFDRVQNDNAQYETGFQGVCQRYGVELATSETSVFFSRFLIPTVLRQDPRYFRNPDFPFMKRALYSASRVIITRADSGHQTFNASYVLGGVASQALSDLYVPGQQQGLHPIAHRLTFNMAQDAGFNLIHEFWPDLRRKIFHR